MWQGTKFAVFCYLSVRDRYLGDALAPTGVMVHNDGHGQLAQVFSLFGTMTVCRVG